MKGKAIALAAGCCLLLSGCGGLDLLPSSGTKELLNRIIYYYPADSTVFDRSHRQLPLPL